MINSWLINTVLKKYCSALKIQIYQIHLMDSTEIYINFWENWYCSAIVYSWYE